MAEKGSPFKSSPSKQTGDNQGEVYMPSELGTKVMSSSAVGKKSDTASAPAPTPAPAPAPEPAKSRGILGMLADEIFIKS